MASKDLSLKSKPIKAVTVRAPDAWFYEEPRGLYIRIDKTGSYRIPWSHIRAALERRDQPNAR